MEVGKGPTSCYGGVICHIILGFDGVYPRKHGKIIRKGEEVLSSSKRIGGHAATDLTMNQYRMLRSSPHFVL
jgi:hypothetical protein